MTEVSGEIQYVLPNGTLTYDGIALLQDIIAGSGTGGGVSDGDKGDITVSAGGTVWTIDANAVSWGEVASKPATFPPDAHALSAHSAATASVDFAQQQAVSFVIENRTSDPGSPVAGQLWLRTDL